MHDFKYSFEKKFLLQRTSQGYNYRPSVEKVLHEKGYKGICCIEINLRGGKLNVIKKISLLDQKCNLSVPNSNRISGK